MSSYRIDEFEGIGPSYAESLQKAGIENTGQLLERAGGKKGRVELAAASEISEKRILTWVNLADLMRVNGVGKQFAELLEAAGVDSVKELRQRNAENLAQAMAEKNAERKLTGSVPAASQVQGWIDEAKQMEPAVTH